MCKNETMKTNNNTPRKLTREGEYGDFPYPNSREEIGENLHIFLELPILIHGGEGEEHFLTPESDISTITGIFLLTQGWVFFPQGE